MNVPKSTVQIYRDCMRLVNHIAGNSQKSRTIKKLIYNEFIKHKDITDEDRITSLRANAVRGLANYLMMENAAKDKKFQTSSRNFVSSEVESLNKK